MKIATLCMGVTLALGASAGAQASTPAKRQLGVVTSAVETIVRQEPDGSTVTIVRPVKDLAAFFGDMGISVPIAPASSICLRDVTVIGDEDGGGGGSLPPSGGNGSGNGGNEGGGGGGYNNKPVPPSQDAATAAGTNPPQSVTSDPNVTTFSETISFNDGWSAIVTWGRNSPSDPWFNTKTDWTPPNHGSGAGNSTQDDCDEVQE